MNVARDLFFAQNILTTIFSLTNKLQVRGDSALKDLTIRQMLAIPAIIHAPQGEASINHIARTLKTSKQSAKQIIDVMEKKHYVSVEPSSRDRRAVKVVVTAQGEQAFRLCGKRTDVFLADLFDAFNTQELETLWTLLQKLYAFDGVQQTPAGPHGHHQAPHTDDSLPYHPDFVQRRTTPHAKQTIQ